MPKPKANQPKSNASLNGLTTALLNGNPAVQQHLAASGKSLDEILGSASNQASGGATRGGLLDLFGGGDSGSQTSGGSDILGSLLGSMLGGAPSAPPAPPQQIQKPTGGQSRPKQKPKPVQQQGGGQSYPQQVPQQQGGGAGDLLGSLLGNMLGGGAPQGGPSYSQPMPQQQSQGGDLLGSLLGSLMGGGQSATPQQMPQQNTDPMGALLGGLLGANTGGGTGGGITNAFVQPIAAAISSKTGIPIAIAQLVVAFALQKIMSSATSQGVQGRFDPVDLVNTLQTDGKVSPTYLKNSGLVSELAQQSGLDQKTATRTLQQAFQALATHVGEGSAEDQQAALRQVLGNMA